MAKYKGKDFLLKSGDAASPEVFTTIAGMRSTSMSLNNETIDVTDKDNMPWRQLLGVGVQSFEVSAAGIFNDGNAKSVMWARAFDGSAHNYRLASGAGDTITGSFIIASMERAGEFNGEETYTIKLQSAGAMTLA